MAALPPGGSAAIRPVRAVPFGRLPRGRSGKAKAFAGGGVTWEHRGDTLVKGARHEVGDRRSASGAGLHAPVTAGGEEAVSPGLCARRHRVVDGNGPAVGLVGAGLHVTRYREPRDVDRVDVEVGLGVAEDARLVVRWLERDVRGRGTPGQHQGGRASAHDNALPRPSPPGAGRLANLLLQKSPDGTAALAPHAPRWWDVVDIGHWFSPRSVWWP